MNKCACGCGGTPKEKESKYCHGHHMKTTAYKEVMYKNNPNTKNPNVKGTLSEEYKKKISAAMSGRTLTEKHKENIRIAQIGRMLNIETRSKISISMKKTIKERGVWDTGTKGKKLDRKTIRKIREGVIAYIENNGGCRPRIGKNEKRILDELEQMHQHKIERQYPVAGYFLDGYIPELNIAFEIDEVAHFDENGQLKEQDLLRQQEIEDELDCNFVRIVDSEFS